MRIFLGVIGFLAFLMVVIVVSAVIVGDETDEWPFDKPEDAMKLWSMYEGEDDEFADD